jgi:hypothetical protein
MSDAPFVFIAGTFGFDVKAFDAWLATIEGTGAHDELTARRQLAKDALHTGKTDRMVRHLDWMLTRWTEIAATDAATERKRTAMAQRASVASVGRSQLSEHQQDLANRWFGLAQAKHHRAGHKLLLETAKTCLSTAKQSAIEELGRYLEAGNRAAANRIRTKLSDLDRDAKLLTRSRAQRYLATPTEH